MFSSSLSALLTGDRVAPRQAWDAPPLASGEIAPNPLLFQDLKRGTDRRLSDPQLLRDGLGMVDVIELNKNG